MNLLADMDAQPGSLQPGPRGGHRVERRDGADVRDHRAGRRRDGRAAATVTIRGTAADAGGRVGGVEVSVDDGASWHPAAGREAWSYTLDARTGCGGVTLLSRAADDSGNLGAASAGRSVTVGGRLCPCTLFGAMAPGRPAANDGEPIEVGVRFRADAGRRSSPACATTRAPTWTGTRVGPPVERRTARCWPRPASPGESGVRLAAGRRSRRRSA